jgi:hypothetical protein
VPCYKSRFKTPANSVQYNSLNGKVSIGVTAAYDDALVLLVLRRLQEPSQAVSRATISRAVGLVSQAAPFGPCHLAAPRRAAQLPAVLQLEQLENWIGSQVGLGSHELSKKI